MQHRLLLATAALLLNLGGCASVAPPAAGSAAAPASTAATRPDPQALLGTWTVDLRPNPQAPAYLKAFEVTAVEGSRFQGRFYDTPITDGLINSDWGTLRIAFVTRDGSTAYHHSAVLSGGQLEGLSHAGGRGFLAYWRAFKP